MSASLNDSVLEAVRAEGFARVDSDPFFAEISVLDERDGVTKSDIEIALKTVNEKGGKCGAVVIVEIPSLVLSRDAENVPGPQGDAVLGYQILERPLFNLDSETGTGKSAEQISINILNLMHHYRADGLAGLQGNFSAGQNAVKPYTAAKGLVGYRVELRAPVTAGRSRKVTAPIISVTDGEMTLTCATSGATIYYTTDGSAPYLSNEDVAVYSEPTAVDDGMLIRAVAVVSGYLPSDARALVVE